MANFDRFDICEAHCVLEWDYNNGGWLRERPSNQRHMRSTGVQLVQMNFRPAIDLGFDSLTDNGKEIYLEKVLKWNLPCDDEQITRLQAMFVPEYLHALRPELFGAVPV